MDDNGNSIISDGNDHRPWSRDSWMGALTPAQEVEDSPEWDPHTVPLGPFSGELPPIELYALVRTDSQGFIRQPEEMRYCTEEWLIGALTEAGVQFGGHYETSVAFMLGADPPTAQVVAGWIARAHQHTRPDTEQDTPPDSGGIPGCNHADTTRPEWP